MPDPILTQDILKELVDYNPDTGLFTWKRRDRKWFKSTNSCGVWNSKYAEVQAGGLAEGYILIGIFYRLYRAHRLAWMYVNGQWPAEQIDHINHMRDDNRICNLREVTRSENNRNHSFSPRNTSGYTGICWDKSRNKWGVKIMAYGKQIYLGRFKDLSNAINARKEAELKYGFHANHGRVVC